MHKFFNSWRYYSYEKEQYYECMDNLFRSNLYNLHKANRLVALLAVLFIPFPLFFEKNYFSVCFYLAVALIAAVLSYYAHYKMQTENVSTKFIYVFTSIYYVNLMSFGIYLGVWSAPDKLATVYLCFLVIALLMFINRPIFSLCLTLISVTVFIICTLTVKTAENAVYDIVGTSIAAMFSLYFNWFISKLRMGLELSANMLEDDRNKYLNQSTIDELTQLYNRRDFMHTFQRYLSNYRTSDDYLCVAISDIDFFKNYNDHYGHPKGDECLRHVGAALTKLKETMGVYVARVGGEEFALLWFEKDLSHVDDVINTMMKYIREMKIPHAKSSISKNVTMSLGVYVERLGESNDVQTLYDAADKALYAAKGNGRNCAIITGKDLKQYKIS